jgi:FKBP-type peptidyl-prolyl cis-trans isomerase SlyD
MLISHHKTVTVEYTLSDGAGSILDTSKGREPLTYIHGTKSLIPGFEAALEGKSTKDNFSFIIEPKDGYGEYNDSLIFTLPKERFSKIEDLREGLQFAVNGPQGAMVMTVKNIGEKDVTLDGNHPLAGNTLHFQVEVLEVRDATKEEIEKTLHNNGCGCSADSPDDGYDCECSIPVQSDQGCKGCSDH